MRLSTRLLLAMTALAFLTGSAFGLLTYRRVETSTLVTEVGAVLGILILTIPLALPLTRPLAQMTEAVEAFMRDTSTLAPIFATGEVGIVDAEAEVR